MGIGGGLGAWNLASALTIRILLAIKDAMVPPAKTGQRYRESGQIDWTVDYRQIDRLVRAMNPWPGAYTFVRDAHGMEKKLKIHRALPMRRFIGEPATVIANGSRGTQVGCGKGSLLLIQAQLERKRAMPATEFVRGFSLPAGTRFPQTQTVP